MRRIHYSGGSFVTGDEVAEALMSYARALAESNAADVVNAPLVSESGRIGQARMLLGPSSQIMSTPVYSTAPEPDDQSAHNLREAAGRLGPSRPTSEDHGNESDMDLDMDMDMDFDSATWEDWAAGADGRRSF